MSSTYHVASVAGDFPAVADWYTFNAGSPTTAADTAAAGNGDARAGRQRLQTEPPFVERDGPADVGHSDRSSHVIVGERHDAILIPAGRCFVAVGVLSPGRDMQSTRAVGETTPGSARWTPVRPGAVEESG